jgi:carbon-monoxide dehydrogenase medium subunit
MIPTAFKYQRASTVDEALRLLGESNGEGKLLAGGHSLIPLMKLRLSEPGVLIDIGRIEELRGIRQEGGRIVIGAGTPYYHLLQSDLLRQQAPIIPEATAEIGDPQVRNRGTIGGSLAHADPAADMPAVMIALDAEITLRGPNGQRSVKAEDFFQDLFTVDMAEDEILTTIAFAPVQTAAYAKLHQRASHYAIVGVAAALDLDGSTCRSARIGITGAGSHAMRLTAVEEALAGKELTPETIARAANAAASGLDDLNEDIHASAEYRRAMAGVFTRRAIDAAASRR